jgi:hypothetical protein
MALDVNVILTQMLGAAKTSFGSKWPKAQDLATTSFKALAQNLVDIERMNIAGTITSDQAALLVDMQKHTAKIVLQAVKGLTILAVEAAINAALAVIKDTVNTALGFTLL